MAPKKNNNNLELMRGMARKWRNPVEKLWSILKERVFETPYCTTTAQLEQRVQRVWTELGNDKDLLAPYALVDGKSAKRVSEVIDHQGENNFK